jgi:hypothetical protein
MFTSSRIFDSNLFLGLFVLMFFSRVFSVIFGLVIPVLGILAIVSGDNLLNLGVLKMDNGEEGSKASATASDEVVIHQKSLILKLV